MAVCDEVCVERKFNFNGLSDLIYERVLCNFNRKKLFCAEGKLIDRKEIAVFFLEKCPISSTTVKQICVPNSPLEKESSDGKTTNYLCFPQENFNFMKMMLIYPATQKHVTKYEYCPSHIIEETPEMYMNVTLPYITRESLNLKWVYNILDHIAENDRVIYEDQNTETGFLLIPDFKWNKKRNENLHVLAIVKPRDIKSLRDLGTEHLPLLKNISETGSKVIKELFGLRKSKLRIYFHYLPSYYHLHVHFTNIEYQAPGGTFATKAHLLDSVIRNIELVPDYYKRACLSYVIKENDGLYKLAKDNEMLVNVESSTS